MSRTRWRAAFWSMLGLLMAATSTRAADPVEGKNNTVTYDGTLWAAYKYILEDPDPANPDRDFNGFTIDRVYLTMTSQLGERYTARGRIEMENQNRGTSKIFLKMADIVVNEPFKFKNTRLRFGQTEGLISSWLEKPWGYRVVSKTTTDRYLGLSTNYLGAGWTGSWLDGIIETDLLIANREGFSGDVASSGLADPKYKTFGARADVCPIKKGIAKGLLVGGYGQIAPQSHPWGDNRTIWFGGHAFLAGEGDKFTVGGQYDARKTRATSLRNGYIYEVPSSVISALARYRLTDRTELFGRVDVVDFDTDKKDVTTGGAAIPPGVFDAELAQNVIIAGASHAYTNTLRSILDVSVRTFTDDLYRGTGASRTKVDPDNEIIVSARLEANL